jgi:hypothetical protein
MQPGDIIHCRVSDFMRAKLGWLWLKLIAENSAIGDNDNHRGVNN